MTDNTSPVTVATETDPTTPDDTTVTARFNRKKIAKIAGAATAAAAFLTVFGTAMKAKGKNDFIEDVRTANGDNDEDTAAS